MKTLIAVLAIVALVGCEDPQSPKAIATSNANAIAQYQTICIDGVSYLYSRGIKRESITVKLGTDSKVIRCVVKQ